MTPEEQAAAALEKQKADEQVAEEARKKEEAAHLENKAEVERLRVQLELAGKATEGERARRLKLENRLKELGEEVEEPKLTISEVEDLLDKKLGGVAETIGKLSKENEELGRILLSKQSMAAGGGAGSPASQPEEIDAQELLEAITTIQKIAGITLSSEQAKVVVRARKEGRDLTQDELAALVK